MKEIKLDLKSEETEKDLKPVAGMIVDSDYGYRLIIATDKEGRFYTIDLKNMAICDSGNDLECLKKDSNPIVIGKLTL